MNSDSVHANNWAILTIIPLSITPLLAQYITDEMIDIIRVQKQVHKKTYIYYNRRGSSRAWICRDCGHFEKCPHCDIAYAVHLDPRKELVCHQCWNRESFPLECSNCGGVDLVGVGVGLQQMEKNLSDILWEDFRLCRIDSDNRIKDRELYIHQQDYDVFLMTQRGITLHADVWAVIFPCFEINLSLPDYQMEEKLFLEIQYFKKQNIHIALQTYTPDHELLSSILHGNQKQFLESLSRERKTFGYPPFWDFITIKIHHIKKEMVRRLMDQSIQLLFQFKKESTFLAFDHEHFERHAGEWIQKIIIKDKDLQYLLPHIEPYIIRNRSITLEWN